MIPEEVLLQEMAKRSVFYILYIWRLSLYWSPHETISCSSVAFFEAILSSKHCGRRPISWASLMQRRYVSNCRRKGTKRCEIPGAAYVNGCLQIVLRQVWSENPANAALLPKFVSPITVIFRCLSTRDSKYQTILLAHPVYMHSYYKCW
jgi:hypothetical protein